MERFRKMKDFKGIKVISNESIEPGTVIIITSPKTDEETIEDFVKRCIIEHRVVKMINIDD